MAQGVKGFLLGGLAAFGCVWASGCFVLGVGCRMDFFGNLGIEGALSGGSYWNDGSRMCGSAYHTSDKISYFLKHSDQHVTLERSGHLVTR